MSTRRNASLETRRRGEHEMTPESPPSGAGDAGQLLLDDSLPTRLLWVLWIQVCATLAFLGISYGLAALHISDAFTEWQRSASPIRQVLVPVFIIGSLLFAEAVRSRKLRGSTLMVSALLFEAFAALFLSMVVNGRTWASEISALSFSPVAIWILVFASTVPLAPRLAAVGGLVAAALDPVGLWILVALDPAVEMPDPVQQLWRFVPGFVCVVPAVVISRLVHRLSDMADAARSLGPYRLDTLLGKGGMAEVWEGEHRLLARRAAIKIVRPEWLQESPQHAEMMIERFQREVRATSALFSPHTIAVYDFGRSVDGTFYYVMELLHGIDLHTLVQQEGPLPPARVVHILRQACHSLFEAHEVGLGHRDIKPANLFVCRYGIEMDFVKVLDFGLVKHKPDSEDGVDSQTLTREGAYTGTPAFIAPEIALGREDIADGRTDLYGLGCVGYWLLSGELVFPLGPSTEMVAAHAHDQPKRPSERGGVQIPPALEDVIMRLLRKDPADRPRTARVLSDQLDEVERQSHWAPWGEAERAGWWSRRSPAQP